MPEPAYILENGTPVPYVPVDVKTARDAYAASLHVLFKHVADFHICIVRTFSAKYGIPEDEILQTIQESEEFKNMKVDPVLDSDRFNTLGYLQSTSVQAEPVKEAPPPPPLPPVKKPKTKKLIPSVVEPIVVAEEERRNAEQQEQEPIKPRIIRKKVVQKSAATPSTAPPPTAVNLFDMDAHATNVIAANTNGTLEAQIAPTPPIPAESEPIKSKTIRKKVVQKQVEVVAPATTATNVAPATTATNVAPATSGTDAPRKIIRKRVASAV